MLEILNTTLINDENSYNSKLVFYVSENINKTFIKKILHGSHFYITN